MRIKVLRHCKFRSCIGLALVLQKDALSRAVSACLSVASEVERMKDYSREVLIQFYSLWTLRVCSGATLCLSLRVNLLSPTKSISSSSVTA